MLIALREAAGHPPRAKGLLMIPGFSYERVTTADGVALNAAVGGSGTPLVLLHGFPQTHLMWRHVAADLAADHTVICPDLRGYGASDKPAERADGSAYSKRTMAADAVALATALGHERFALAGHDRGALVAFRAGLDHPGTITHLACLDVLPTLDMWDVLSGMSAAPAFHLYLMALPPGLPETLIANSADAFFGWFLDAWGADAQAIPADVRAAYLDACRQAVPSIVADYRASAGIDVEHDTADRAAGTRLQMPTTVVQQDWGALLGYDAQALWSAWSDDLHHVTADLGHFMAESAPQRIVAELRALLAR
ncbi:alpha/beta hydrolase [Conexibacter sp. JD483]|uniref:alpha/beta fold hydrolase n=1 Tax=unclassified Conexibacter TaxID=2627773 RepID=UPI00271F0139|nr:MULTISPECIES: alpha/beta hydrolase [unclassified Conexibacter]MDO8189494.1 alpha/beta hydrolase [Conexibacter sp. CPCC 205706]MDO8202084.1 alpha/beta hydrolase [Conexibacter sp. CPCC 205762]MDR9372720.1 alpha/beta hydrolase [Conexibacter sp. JD483]